MSTSNPTIVKRVLQETIYYHLDNYLFNNALFFAEKLAAFDSHSPQSRLLLGLCYFRLDDFHSALEALKPTPPTTPELGCTWIYAQCCFALKKYNDGATALEGSKSLWPQTTRVGKGPPSVRGVYPDRSALLCLLGKLYRKLDNTRKAIQHFESALKGNPFMWDAFTNLCDMGVTISVPNVFNVTDSLVQSFDSSGESCHSGTTCDTASSSARQSSVRASSNAKDTSSNAGGSQQVSATLTGGIDHSVTGPGSGNARARAMAALAASMRPAPLPPPAGSPSPRGPQNDIFRNSVRRAHVHRVAEVELTATGALPRMTQSGGTKRNSSKETRVKGEGKERTLDKPKEHSLSATPTKGRKRLRSNDRLQVRIPGTEEAGTPRTRPLVSTSLESPTSQASDANRESHNAPNACPPSATKKARRLLSKIMTTNQNETQEPNVERDGADALQQSVSAGVNAARSSMPTHPKPLAKPLPPIEKRPEAPNGVESSLKWTLNLLKILGVGYYALSRFQCKDALNAFNEVPDGQNHTPWVLGQIGRAYFECGDYDTADMAFGMLRQKAPTRHRDLEVYSTVLWHLDRQEDLSFLAHELLDQSWHSPEA